MGADVVLIPISGCEDEAKQREIFDDIWKRVWDRHWQVIQAVPEALEIFDEYVSDMLPDHEDTLVSLWSDRLGFVFSDFAGFTSFSASVVSGWFSLAIGKPGVLSNIETRHGVSLGPVRSESELVREGPPPRLLTRGHLWGIYRNRREGGPALVLERDREHLHDLTEDELARATKLFNEGLTEDPIWNDGAGWAWLEATSLAATTYMETPRGEGAALATLLETLAVKLSALHSYNQLEGAHSDYWWDNTLAPMFLGLVLLERDDWELVEFAITDRIIPEVGTLGYLTPAQIEEMGQLLQQRLAQAKQRFPELATKQWIVSGNSGDFSGGLDELREYWQTELYSTQIWDDPSCMTVEGSAHYLQHQPIDADIENFLHHMMENHPAYENNQEACLKLCSLWVDAALLAPEHVNSQSLLQSMAGILSNFIDEDGPLWPQAKALRA